MHDCRRPPQVNDMLQRHFRSSFRHMLFKTRHLACYFKQIFEDDQQTQTCAKEHEVFCLTVVFWLRLCCHVIRFHTSLNFPESRTYLRLPNNTRTACSSRVCWRHRSHNTPGRPKNGCAIMAHARTHTHSAATHSGTLYAKHTNTRAFTAAGVARAMHVKWWNCECSTTCRPHRPNGKRIP